MVQNALCSTFPCCHNVTMHMLGCHNVMVHLLCCQNCAGAHHLALRRAKCKKLAPYWLLIKRAPREWLIDGRWQQFGLIATWQPALFGILSHPRIIFDQLSSRPLHRVPLNLSLTKLRSPADKTKDTIWPVTQTYETYVVKISKYIRIRIKLTNDNPMD